jgi:hypothetical protein
VTKLIEVTIPIVVSIIVLKGRLYRGSGDSDHLNVASSVKM